MSSRFITESEASEIRKRRQEEWEKVRKPSDPVERPEEPYDNRSLFEKLQEQKQKKELEYEEAHKLKNMIKGLDDDEIEFLDLVDRTKIAADRKKEIEEEKELNDYRNRVAILQEKSIEERLQADVVVNKPKNSVSNNNLNQQKLLKGVVIKQAGGVKRKMESGSHSNGSSSGNQHGNLERSPKQSKTMSVSDQGDSSIDSSSDSLEGADSSQVALPSAQKCIAVLPGLGYYEDSSSDDNSSDSDRSAVESSLKTDLLGRKLTKSQNQK